MSLYKSLILVNFQDGFCDSLYFCIKKAIGIYLRKYQDTIKSFI